MVIWFMALWDFGSQDQSNPDMLQMIRDLLWDYRGPGLDAWGDPGACDPLITYIYIDR